VTARPSDTASDGLLAAIDRPRQRRLALGAGLSTLGIVLATATTAVATSFVPMSIEDLTRGSVATLIARVQATRGVASGGHIHTLVDLKVEEVLQGLVPGSRITLREPGGSADGVEEVVDGAAVYAVGEQVVVFLAVWPDGSLRTNHLALGRWVVDRDASGGLRARQTFGRTVTLLPPAGREMPASVMPLTAVRDAVDRGRTAPSAVPPAPTVSATPPEGRAGDGTSAGDTSPFVLFDPARRFFEPDEGVTLDFLVDDRGDSILGLPASRQAVDDAMAEWTGVASATIAIDDAGLTADLNTGCAAGSVAPLNPHRIVFDDPTGMIPPPTSCSGTLAVGGGCRTNAETKVFAATTFERLVKGTVVFADGWTGCAFWTQCNVAEVATHELGHMLGLDHTPDTDATMFPTAHGDGRCADVRTDDVNGVSFIYPTAIPPTITTATPLPPGQTFAVYTQTLAAGGGTGVFTWSEIFNGCPGLTLSAGGTFSGTPSFMGTCDLVAKATDGDGDSHTKRFTLEVTESGTTTTTTTTLPSGGCTGPADCADGDPCTNDQCAGGQCSNPSLVGIDGAQCLLGELVPANVCGSESIHPKVLTTMTKKLARASTLLGRAESASTDAKRAKLIARAGKGLTPIVTKATRFASKGKISAECAAAIRQVVDALRQALAG
jgi:hypothetical protein